MADESRLVGLRNHNESLNQVIKDSLQQALIILMKEKEYSQITITELCKKAGVSRMAFYGNFKSKDELLKVMVMQLNAYIISRSGSPFRQTTDIMWYEECFKSVKLFSSTLKLIFDAGFKDKYLSIITELVLHDKSISNEKKYQRIIWAGGIVNVIISWLDGGMSEPIEKIATFCNDNLSVWTR